MAQSTPPKRALDLVERAAERSRGAAQLVRASDTGDSVNMPGPNAAPPPAENVAKALPEVLVRQGRLSTTDVDRVLEHAERHAVTFGEAAVSLNLVSRTELDLAVAEQFGYPYLAKGLGGYSRELVAAYEPFSPRGEAMRNLRRQVLLNTEGQKQRTLAVVGVGNSAVSSQVAANLAIVFSQHGSRTLLIDADVHHARQSELFALKTQTGLSYVLVRGTDLGSAIERMPHFRGLWLLPAGFGAPNAGDLFARSEWPMLVRGLARHYETVIVDTPALSESAGTEFIARECGDVLVVLEKGRTRVRDVKSLTAALENAGARILGSIVVG